MNLLNIPELPSFQRVPSSSNSSIDVAVMIDKGIFGNYLMSIFIIEFYLGVEGIEKHVIGAKPLGGVDSRDKERVF